VSVPWLQAEVLSAARARLPLWGDLALADPALLAVLPCAGLVALWVRARGRPGARISLVSPVPVTLRQRLAFVPPLLQGLALVAASLALARPVRSNVQQSVHSEGIDIALALDRSGSMQFEDLERGRNRLEVVKEVVGEFARRRMTDREGAADSVALIAFARYPQLLCPFTLDADALTGFLGGVALAQREEEDGTAIGVALAKAVAVLRESEARSRVCVLLTDGENNVDDITPDSAAELAAEEGIKVYTVFAARHVYSYHPFQGWVPTNAVPDTGELERMAQLTGGRFFRATDRAELADIYAEIERLERTPRSERRFEETHDLYPWLLFPALLAALGAQLARATLWRRLS
jgi:Ca-activated chloride channel family protein